MDKRMIGKIISSQRTKKGMSLNELCNGICNKSTLMRIEEGEINTNSDILTRLLERLGIHVELDDNCNFDDILVRQIIRSANQSDIAGNHQEAIRLLDTIGNDYDSFSSQNKQRYDVISTMLLFEEGGTSLETRLVNLEKSMRQTQLDYSFENLPLVMTDMEVQILRHIATTYGMMDDYEKAIVLYSHLKSYLESDTDKVNSARKLANICYNLSKSLGLVGRYDDSIAVAEESIRYCEYLNNISLLPSCIYNCAWSLVRRNNNGDKERAKELISEAKALCTPKTWNVKELSDLLEKLSAEVND